LFVGVERETLSWGPVNQDGSGEITMTLHSSKQAFVFEIIGVDLFIRLGRYELSWDRNGFCVCKGMETLWANWH
jgi:hypothetical protein